MAYVGRSGDALAAPVAAQRRLPAIWLTPLLRSEEHVADLRAMERFVSDQLTPQ